MTVALCLVQGIRIHGTETRSDGNDIGGSPMTAHTIEFPKDHCFHANTNEWVYFSGVVETGEGQEFGVMFTIFQFSGFGGGFTYSSMLGISDPEISKFYSARMNAHTGTVGSTPDGLPAIEAGTSQFIWKSPDNLHIASSVKTSDMTDIAVEMDMTPTRDVLLHGEDGWIPMGDGIPSGYSSLTNLLPTNGTLRIGERQYTIVGGRMWMDRQCVVNLSSSRQR